MEEIWRLHYIRFWYQASLSRLYPFGVWRLHPYFFGLRVLTLITIGFDVHLAEFQVLRFNMSALFVS